MTPCNWLLWASGIRITSMASGTQVIASLLVRETLTFKRVLNQSSFHDGLCAKVWFQYGIYHDEINAIVFFTE